MKLVLQIYEENLDNKLGRLLLVHCQNLLLERYKSLKFCVHNSVHHKSMYLEDQRDAVLSSQYLFTAKSLYMFRVSPAPIIRSTQTVVTTTGTSHEFEDVMIKSD